MGFMNIRKNWKYNKGGKMMFFGVEGVEKTSCFWKNNIENLKFYGHREEDFSLC
jgi:hypothetical protein